MAKDYSTFDIENEISIFETGQEPLIGQPKDDHIFSIGAKVAFGHPNGIRLRDGTLLTFFWCTIEDVTHTRWVRLEVS